MLGTAPTLSSLSMSPASRTLSAKLVVATCSSPLMWTGLLRRPTLSSSVLIPLPRRVAWVLALLPISSEYQSPCWFVTRFGGEQFVGSEWSWLIYAHLEGNGHVKPGIRFFISDHLVLSLQLR